MNSNEDKVEAQIWLDAEPAVDKGGGVRLIITKLYPQVTVSHGYSKFQGGYTAIPNGKLVVEFPQITNGARELTANQFADLLDRMVVILKGSVLAFVDINIASQKEASQKFHAAQEEGDEIA